jgi:hypothetical protein
VFPKHEALVRGVHDDRIVKLPQCIKLVKKSADVVIDAFDATQKLFQVRVVGEFFVFMI